MNSECQTHHSELMDADALRRRLDLEREKLEAAQRQLAADQAALALEQDAVTEERERLAAARAKLENNRNSMEAERDNDNSPERAAVTSDLHDSAATDEDIFARLRALSVLRDDQRPGVDEATPLTAATEPVEATSASTIESLEVTQEPAVEEPVMAAVASATPASTAPAHHGEEESIDDYMARLLARLNGGRREEPPGPVAQPATPIAAISTEESPPASESEALEPAPEAPAAERLAEPLNMTPRRNAPEREVDFRAMRELANMSANSAIGASQRRQWTSSAAVKLGAAAALGLFGLALIYLGTSEWAGSTRSTVFGFGAVLFVAGAAWSLQGITLLYKAWGVGTGAAAAPSQAEPTDPAEKSPAIRA